MMLRSAAGGVIFTFWCENKIALSYQSQYARGYQDCGLSYWSQYGGVFKISDSRNHPQDLSFIIFSGVTSMATENLRVNSQEYEMFFVTVPRACSDAGIAKHTLFT